MPTKMEMDSAHTIEAQLSTGEFVQTVTIRHHQLPSIDSDAFPCPPCLSFADGGLQLKAETIPVGLSEPCQGAGKSGSVGAPPIAMTAVGLRWLRFHFVSQPVVCG